MPLPRDPDVLRVPAFMRKRNLRVRARRPLVLTAFDRKQAGEMLPVLVKPKPAVKKPRVRAKLRRQPIPKKVEVFSAPLFSAPLMEAKKSKPIGTLTHYYDKIKVGVIKLTGTLCVGDCILYKTDEGAYEQIVESLEINREPVFKGGRGKEVGLKLRKIPRVGCSVLKT